MKFDFLVGLDPHHLAAGIIVVAALALAFLYFMPAPMHRRHNVAFWLAALLVFALTPFAAFADDLPVINVDVPWGQWLSAELLGFVQQNAWPIVSTLALALAAKIGGPMGAAITTAIHNTDIDAAVEKSIDAGIGAVAGAVRGKSWDLQTTNSIFAAAVTYAMKAEPVIAKKGEDLVRLKLFSRLSAMSEVPATASASTVGVKLPQ